MKFVATLIVLVSLVLASTADAKKRQVTTNNAENYIQNHWYSLNGEPYPVKNAHCTKVNEILFTCDVKLREIYTDPQFDFWLYNQTFLVDTVSPLSLANCQAARTVVVC